MIYEIRHYDAAEGKFDQMRQRFEREVVPRLPKHGIELVGLFACPETPGRMTYMTRYPSEEARKQGWASFGADAEWKAAKAASETNGPLLAKQTILVLDPIGAGLLLS